MGWTDEEGGEGNGDGVGEQVGPVVAQAADRCQRHAQRDGGASGREEEEGLVGGAGRVVGHAVGAGDHNFLPIHPAACREVGRGLDRT